MHKLPDKTFDGEAFSFLNNVSLLIFSFSKPANLTMASISVFRSLKYTGTVAAAFEVLQLGEGGGILHYCNFRYSERLRTACAS